MLGRECGDCGNLGLGRRPKWRRGGVQIASIRAGHPLPRDTHAPRPLARNAEADGAVANTLRENGEGRVAATAIAAGTAWVVIQLVLTAITAALAHSIATDGDDTGVRALFNLSWILDMMGALPIAAFVLAVSVGLRRTQMTPQWLSWGGVVVAVLLALRSTTWARDGFWSPTGGYLFIVIPLALLWILITSIVLVRSAPVSVEQPMGSATPTV